MAQKITPCLWFEKDCEEATNYYIKVFNEAPHSRKNSKINFILRYEKGIETPGAAEMEGKVLTGDFQLDGQRYLALDGAPGPRRPLRTSLPQIRQRSHESMLGGSHHTLAQVVDAVVFGGGGRRPVGAIAVAAELQPRSIFVPLETILTQSS